MNRWLINKVHSIMLNFIRSRPDELRIALFYILDERYKTKDSLVVCDGCRCLLNRFDAVRGDSTISKATSYSSEHLVEHYFCLKCYKENANE